MSHDDVLREDDNSKLDTIIEMLSAIPTLTDFRRLEADVSAVKREVQAVRLAVKDLSARVDRHVTDDRLHFMDEPAFFDPDRRQ